VRQNSELLRALDELEKTCTTLKEENGLLRKSSAPETEEKVRRLRRKNTELSVLAKRLEERARKLQEANLRVNSPSLLRPGSVEHYKRAFARQRARDLAQHADLLLSKDKEIAALQQECRELEARQGVTKGSPVPSGRVEFERLLRESQREVLRLQRQLSITSSRQQHSHSPDPRGPERCGGIEEEDEEEKEEEEDKESELSKKRKECENLEHEVKKRQKRCLDLVSNLLASEEGALREMMFSSLSCCQTRAENEELREDLSEVTAQHNSVLEENQRLRAKLENLEQVLKHMREVAERRQQLELEHEQALAILKFKQDEIKRLQRAQLYAKREHEGVVQVLESKVRDLEDKCRSQSEQFGLLSQELEKFRLQASAVDLAGASLLSNPSLSLLTNGVGPAELERSPVTKHRELPTISVSKSGSSSSKSETVHLTPKSDTHLMDTASEVEELDIDVAPAPYTASRGAAKLQVFIARYSYNPYDGPNDNPEVRASTHGWRIHAMCMATWTTDGFYEGPPDAPSDVQLEHGPSPAIALIIRVTGYTIYADKKKGTNFKVLEVSCPTAGSALLGPSQMQSLLAAQELTLRTMSELANMANR
uniref:TSPO associated protein 1 n=1 Tax=Cyclopterus lumpus TaxID=8103 RepID=A0A8C2ZD57_CYCLU